LREALIDSLNEFAREHGDFPDMPPPTLVKHQFFEKPFAEYHGRQKLKAILANLHILAGAAAAAKEKQAKKIGSNPPHKGDLSLDIILNYLGMIYGGVYMRVPPKASRSGPFARFLSSVLLALGEHRNTATPSSLAQRWSRIKREI